MAFNQSSANILTTVPSHAGKAKAAEKPQLSVTSLTHPNKAIW